MRVDPPHQFHGIINRVAKCVSSCGRWPAIQGRYAPHQEHSGHELDQFLSALVHLEDKMASSLYIRLTIFRV
jgi:hypothetical protein